MCGQGSEFVAAWVYALEGMSVEQKLQRTIGTAMRPIASVHLSGIRVRVRVSVRVRITVRVRARVKAAEGEWFGPGVVK